ncbi:MAG: 50S ribosomal protein L31 [Rickettsiaceae bacterium]|nr:MAG: 50S ribosomal protein L31 [Rickettsiaceae bacterium]
MKGDIHPQYNKIKILIGEDFLESNSTMASGEHLMEIDFRLHPAWTGGLQVTTSSVKNVVDFNKKFAGLTFGMKQP